MSDFSICQVYRLGVIEYQKAWNLQKQLAEQIAAGEHPPTLLLLEHPHTYTFGSKGQAENLLWQQAQLQDQKVEVHWVDRGGDVTYHGPGQLVGYPILPLGLPLPEPDMGKTRLPQRDFIRYLRDLEKVLIRSLAHQGVPAGQVRGQTGVWLQPDVASRCLNCPPEFKVAPSKVASIGVKVNVRGVSQHGFALNVAPDMAYWTGIKACGLDNQNQISLEQVLNKKPDMDQVADSIIEEFGRVFEFEMRKSEGVVLL
jgi:lipoate-protein ligase B